jgi:predicted HTH transcriptional regulator
VFQPDPTQLLARMRRFEDHFTERKTSNDLKDMIKTLVAFGNSTPPNASAVLYLGVRDSGEIETPQPNLDNLQKSFRKDLEKVYTPLQTTSVAIEENGRQALAIVVPHSENRPHFGGQSWVRVGSESLPASREQFSELIASRNSKVSKILEYKGKQISVMNSRWAGHTLMESHWGEAVTVHFCDQFYVTLETSTARHSFELDVVTISYDNNFHRLLLKLNR